MRIASFLVALVCVTLNACDSGDDPAGPDDPIPTDTTPPAAVTDLRVVSMTAERAVLVWTAPGDDGTTGTATAYDIGHSVSAITPVSWETCAKLATCPDPQPAGTEQTVEIDSPPGPEIFVALKAVDEAGNWSSLSNVAHGQLSTGIEVFQLTDEGNNIHPCVSDGFVTWSGHLTAAGQEIYIAGLRTAHPTPTALTDTGGEKWHPSSHGAEKIVWQERHGGSDDWEVYVYSSQSIPRFRAHTDNAVPDVMPVLAGAGHFAWLQGGTLHQRVMYWNESLHDESVLSDDCCPTTEYSNEYVKADDFTVMWWSWHRAGSGVHRLYRWHGGLDDITSDIEGGVGFSYSLSAGELAYEWGSGPKSVRHWNGTTVSTIASGYSPSLDHGWIAFEAWDGHDWEIRLWNGIEILEVTDNDFDDTEPSLSDDLLAWAGRPAGSGTAYQIFYARLQERN